MSETFRILHVTQASSGGVLHALVQLANSQSASGADVHVLLGRRDDTPSPEALRGLFAEKITVAETSSRGMTVRGTFVFYMRIVQVIRRLQPNFVHLHSSFAGAVGRLAALTMNRRKSTFYSPHGFSFLRQDVPASKRSLFAFMERLLHAVGSSLVLVSGSEHETARRVLTSKRLFVLENGIQMDSLPARRQTSSRPLVGTAGRVTYAKAPWKFSALAEEFTDSADFQWVGGGNEIESDKWISATFVQTTGWQTEENAVHRIAGLDIYVSTSLWEGLPIAVVQAQALGIPCVVSNCVGNIDIIQHGVTGFIARTDQELRDYLRRLIDDATLRRDLGDNAAGYARERFDSRKLGPQSFQIYSDAVIAS